MGALDIFSGEDGRNTSIWSAGQTQAGANQQRSYLNKGLTQSLAALGKGTATARADVTGQYNAGAKVLAAGRDASLEMLNRNPELIQQYGGMADTALTGAGAAGDQYLAGAGSQADAYYQPLAAGADRGFSAYGDAAGVNGAEGQARARDNFQTGPGYTFARDEALQAATRGANATGMGASGNTMDALSRLGNNLANQEWGNYVSRLNPYLQLAPQIAGARGNIATSTAQNRAGLARDIANSRAGVFTGMSDDLTANNAGLAGIYTGYGKDAAALRMGQGNTLASLASGLGSNEAGLYSDRSHNLSNVTGAETAALTQQGQAGMLAGQSANQNTWNAGMQLANLAANSAPKVASAFK